MSKSVTVFVNEKTLPDSRAKISVKDELGFGLSVGIHVYDDTNKFIPYIGWILTFHKRPDVETANRIISTDAEMFTVPDYDKSDELLEQIYEEKKAKIRASLVGQRENSLKSQIVYSNPALLAFAHGVVSTYPNMISGIENSVYVDRAFKFISGSYLFMLERAMNPPVDVLQHRDDEDVSDFTKAITHWRVDCARTTFVLLAQYGVTGDEKYLQIMDKWPIYSRVKTHRILVQLVDEAISKQMNEIREAGPECENTPVPISSVNLSRIVDDLKKTWAAQRRKDMKSRQKKIFSKTMIRS